MRIILAGVALGVVLLGTWVIIGQPRDKPTTPGASRSDISRATADAVQAAQQFELTPPPTLGPSLQLQREVMIYRAMGQARAMGEQSPRLEDVRLVTVAELADTDYVSLGEDADNHGPPTKQVFVVRVAGRFTPLDLPYEVDDT